jgi:hypothetical protein
MAVSLHTLIVQDVGRTKGISAAVPDIKQAGTAGQGLFNL